MQILWTSDLPNWPTGFGNITRALCSGLSRLGHQVSIIGSKEGSRPLHRRQYTVYPGDGRNPNADSLLGYLRKLRPDVLVTLIVPGEATSLTTSAIEQYRLSAGIVWILYYPIDCDQGRKGLSADFVRFLKRADLRVVLSRYGRDLTRRSDLSATYIPAGVDTNLFRPPDNKIEAKRALGYESQFVVLCDARNQIRKALPRTLEIFRRFAAGKDHVRLHIHCDPYDPAARTDDYSYNILSDVELLRLGDKVRFTRDMSIYRGLSLARLAALYQSADVHLLTSCGEGFGMPTLQAAAAGVVPLAPAYAANRELVKGHGEAIRVRRFVRNQTGWRCALVDIDDAAGKLERLYRDPALLRSKAQAARRFAELYDWKEITWEWHKMLESKVPRLHAKLAGRRAAAQAAERFPGKTADDASDTASRFTFPVTLPSADVLPARTRIPGRVCLAGRADIGVFRELVRVFPGLTAWSPNTSELKLERHRAFKCIIVAAKSPEFRSYLATSTLALDLGCVESVLPLWAAEFGVPLIGLRRNAEQQKLWPNLTLDRPDVLRAAEKARWMLTDQVEAADACALARKLYHENERDGKKRSAALRYRVKFSQARAGKLARLGRGSRSRILSVANPDRSDRPS